MARKIIDPNKLTEFEEQFIDIYFNMNFNGRLAYKKLKPGVKDTTADTEASKILSYPKVKDAIEMKQEQIRMKEDIQLSWIVQELKNIILDVKQEQIERDPISGKIYIKPDRKSALAALQQLSKIAGFETKKVDITTNGESIETKEIKINIIPPTKLE
jgi:hypothetical protein